MAPPYLFSGIGVGLIEIAAIIGFILACFGGGYLSDLLTTRLIVRSNGSFFPEQRMWSLLPLGWIAPVGCIIAAVTCANGLSWVGVAFGFGMGEESSLDMTIDSRLLTEYIVSFGTVYSPNIAITYVIESYPRLASEGLVVINVFKNLVAFVLVYLAVEWVQSDGWIQVYMIMFMLTTLALIFAVPLYFYGERLREITNRWARIEA